MALTNSKEPKNEIHELRGKVIGTNEDICEELNTEFKCVYFRRSDGTTATSQKAGGYQRKF